MAKAIVAFALLLLTINSFKLYDSVVALNNPKPLTDIPWPFTLCGEGTWTPTSLTLGSKPSRSATDSITLVNICLHRLEPLMMMSPSQSSSWKSSSMAPSFTQRTFNLPNQSQLETPFNSSSPTISLPLLLPETTSWIWPSKMEIKQTDACPSPSNYENDQDKLIISITHIHYQ